MFWAVTEMLPESSEHVHLNSWPDLIGPSVTAPVTTSTDGMLGIKDLLSIRLALDFYFCCIKA